MNRLPAALKGAIPWWIKIAGKLVLSRLPVSFRAWRRLGLFLPGAMQSPAYAIAVFQRHFQQGGQSDRGFRYLELGPGGSITTAIVAWAYGAGGGYLVDTEPLTPYVSTAYRGLLEALAKGKAPRDVTGLAEAGDPEAILTATHAAYLHDGLNSLREIPSEEVDFLFSHAVMEHVPLTSFAEICDELYRILKPGGIASHVVDFQDHLGGSLNNLRFSEKLWEAPWFAARSGFYTNRLRYSEMRRHFEKAGFKVDAVSVNRWNVPPLPRNVLHENFQALAEDDLKISGTHFRLTKQT